MSLVSIGGFFFFVKQKTAYWLRISDWSSDVCSSDLTILVTSSVPREGKSTVAISMARLMARSGRKVLLVDGDLRRPRVNAALGLQSKPGLVAALSRSVALEDALRTDPDTTLDVLPAGGRPTSPPDLLPPSQMRTT